MIGNPANGTRKLRYVDPATFTPQFAWKPLRNGQSGAEVFCEEVPLARVAQEVGTPTYAYSRAAIEQSFREFERGLAGLPHTICYAVKANSNLALLRVLARLGSGFDIVSGGELERLRRAGVSGERIVFSGVGKSREEIREALGYRSSGRGRRSGILLFNVESAAELDVLMEESARRGGMAPAVSVRVNPDVQAGGHPHIATGRYQHKFGLDWPAARRLYLAHRESKWIQWQGISSHIGSQVLSLTPFRRALRRLASYFIELRHAGIDLQYLDCGGGLGVRYTDQQPPQRRAYAREVREIVRPLGCHLLLEPGRSIVAQAGVLLTRVVYTKENRGKTFVVVDAAMNDLIRPALYDAVHPITRVQRNRKGKSAAAKRKAVDIVGPVCESGDCFVHDWPMEDAQSGDLLAIWSAGAYGSVQASNYNARPRPTEVLIEGKRYRIIRRRETSADLLRGELMV